MKPATSPMTFLTHGSALAATLAFFASAMIPARAAPVLIDDFSTELAPITAHDQLDGPMLGGEADFTFGQDLEGTFAISDGTGELSVVAAAGNSYFRIDYDGEDNSSASYAYNLSGVDLTDGGTNDRFVVDLASVSGEIYVRIEVADSAGNYSRRNMPGVTEPGILEFPFDSFLDYGTGADFTAANMVSIRFLINSSGDGVEIDSIMARGEEFPPGDEPSTRPDTTPPTIKLLKKKKLKSPRPRHTIKGTVPADVIRVELKSSLQKGWRRATLKSPEKWKFRTPRLKPGRNRVKIRAIDSTGNVSRITRIKVTGVFDLDPGSGR